MTRHFLLESVTFYLDSVALISKVSRLTPPPPPALFANHSTPPLPPQATVDFEAQDEAVLAKILVPAGTPDVAVGTPMMVLIEDKNDVAAFKDFTGEAAPAASAEEEKEAPAPAEEKLEKPAASEAPAAGAPKPAEKSAGGRLAASPLAKHVSYSGEGRSSCALGGTFLRLLLTLCLTRVKERHRRNIYRDRTCAFFFWFVRVEAVDFERVVDMGAPAGAVVGATVQVTTVSVLSGDVAWLFCRGYRRADTYCTGETVKVFRCLDPRGAIFIPMRQREASLANPELL